MTIKCQGHGCGEQGEIRLTRTRDGATGVFCRAHAEGYGLTAEGAWTRGFEVTAILRPGLGACPRCGRLVMNGARHGYTMNGRQAPCTNDERN